MYYEELSKLRDAPWDAQIREIAAKLLTFEAKKSSLYRTHQHTLPPIPSTRPSIQLEGKFRLTTSQEQFTQADDGDIDKILIFSTTANLLHLCAAETIFCDGTFCLFI